jgi:hypothetical protein
MDKICKTVNWSIYLPFSLMIFLFCACSKKVTRYYPPRNESQTTGFYNRYRNLLDTAYQKSDYATRMKYLPILKQAVADGHLGKGSIESFEYRNENILLSVERP